MALKSNKRKNTDTKSGSYPGSEYWLNAAKQFPWPIDLQERVINVPHNELESAEQDLMVEYFRNNGWHIQSCIEVVHTKPFVKPVSNGPIFKPTKIVEPIPDTKYHKDDSFKIKSSDCELKIVRIEKGKIQFKYTNRPHKHDLLSSEDALDRALKMGYWVSV